MAIVNKISTNKNLQFLQILPISPSNTPVCCHTGQDKTVSQKSQFNLCKDTCLRSSL